MYQVSKVHRRQRRRQRHATFAALLGIMGYYFPANPFQIKIGGLRFRIIDWAARRRDKCHFPNCSQLFAVSVGRGKLIFRSAAADRSEKQPKPKASFI